jgi:signal transduction histidine kinase
MMMMSMLARRSGHFAFGTHTATDMAWFLDRGERARCLAAPEAWGLAGPARTPVWAYDPATRRSANPAAPPLDDDLWIALGEGDMAFQLLGFRNGGAFAARVAPSGPCAVVGGHWPSMIPLDGLFRFLLGCGLIAALIGGLFASLGVVRPLARRLVVVRRAAARVGAAEGYRAVELDAVDDLGALARALDRAHERIRADAAELERRRFELQRHVADVAHDLRTPLSSLQLAVEQAAGASGDPAEARAALLQAVHDVVYVGGLVANLRLASELRGDPGPAPDAEVKLGETVERAALRVSFLARQKRVALEVAVPEAPVVVSGDPIAVEQAIANVIENAVTHNAAGGHVAVLLEEAGGAFQLTVADDGPGVAPGELPRLGARPFRADAARRRDGHGLGLAITTEVCARHGFQLSFARGDPVGLTVTLRGPERLVGK